MSHADLSMPFGRFRITAPPLWVAVALPAAYFAAALASQSVFGANSAIWVSNAFAVTALLRNKRSTWPVLILLVAVADGAANAIASRSPLFGLWSAASDCGEILIVASLARATGVTSMGAIKSMVRLAVICLVVPVLSATEGAILLAFYVGTPFGEGWKTWYLANSFGLLMVTPLLLSWTDPRICTQNLRGRAVPVIVLAGFIAGVTYLDFHDALPGLFLAFPVLLVATFSGGLLGATTGAAAQAAVAIWSTMAGSGDLASFAKTDPVLKTQLLQMYIAIILLLVLPVAAVLEELRERTTEAQAATRAKSEFLAVMSHEIRTPLTSVLGMTDFLMSIDLPPKALDYVRGIRTSGRHLLALVNDILDFSRIEAGKLRLETIDFSIDSLFEELGSLLAPQAVERGLELHFAYEADVPKMLKGDPTRISQVLINLAGNGLKFTSRGSVTIAVARCAGEAGRDRYRFEVRDTGIGIPLEKQPLLFEAFSQVDSSTTRKYGGSGLGLAICRNLVNAMGGEIGVESEPGIGSCFWFEIPLALGEMPLTEAPARRQLVAGRKQRVLLVEDVELNRLLIADMLRSHGHEVTPAANGLEAVEMAEREPFDVILMDVQMPVMNGIEATRRIRKLPPPAGAVPVLALSANVREEDQARYRAAGMNGALAKPIDWPEVFDALALYGGADKAVGQNEAARGQGAAPADTADIVTPADKDHVIEPGNARPPPSSRDSH